MLDYIGGLICLIALITGSGREQAGGLIYLGAYALCFVLGAVCPQSSDWRYLLSDGLWLLGLYHLCWKAPHPWPIWASGCILLAVVADISALSHPQIWPSTLNIVLSLTHAAALICMLIGTIKAWPRRKDGLGQKN